MTACKPDFLMRLVISPRPMSFIVNHSGVVGHEVIRLKFHSSLIQSQSVTKVFHGSCTCRERQSRSISTTKRCDSVPLSRNVELIDLQSPRRVLPMHSPYTNEVDTNVSAPGERLFVCLFPPFQISFISSVTKYLPGPWNAHRQSMISL